MSDWNRFTQCELLKASGSWAELGHQTGYCDRSAGSRGGSFRPFDEPRMSNEQADALERIIVASRERGADVILLLEPNRLSADVARVDIAAYIRWLEERSDEWGVELWDTYSIDWSQDLYADQAHFNRQGAVAYTTYLAELTNDLEPAN